MATGFYFYTDMVALFPGPAQLSVACKSGNEAIAK